MARNRSDCLRLLVLVFVVAGVTPLSAQNANELGRRPAGELGRAEPSRPAPEGHWYAQCAGYKADRDSTDVDARPFGPASPTEPKFVSRVIPCANEKISKLADAAEACDAIERGDLRNACSRARNTMATLALEVCAGRLNADQPVKTELPRCSATTVGEAIDELATLLGRNRCRRAARCASEIR